MIIGVKAGMWLEIQASGGGTMDSFECVFSNGRDAMAHMHCGFGIDKSVCG